MQITTIQKGVRFKLYGVVVDQICPVKEYISGLDEKNLKQIASLIAEIIEHGPPRNKFRFNNLDDGIYELKARSGARILCFFGGSHLRNSLIMTHGFPKPKKKVLEREKKKALDWLDKYSQITNINKHIVSLEEKP